MVSEPIRSIAAQPFDPDGAGQARAGGERSGEEQRVLGDRPPHRPRREPAGRIGLQVHRLDGHVVTVVAGLVQRVEDARQVDLVEPLAARRPPLELDLRHRDPHRGQQQLEHRGRVMAEPAVAGTRVGPGEARARAGSAGPGRARRGRRRAPPARRARTTSPSRGSPARGRRRSPPTPAVERRRRAPRPG